MNKAKLMGHIHNMSLENMVFALPFAYMGMFLASHGLPLLHDFIFITLAMIGARSSALILDNLIDLKYDSQQPRLARRAMVSGAVKPRETVPWIIGCFALFFFAAWQLAPVCIYLTPVAVFILCIYPYTKRFTCLCHFILGAALAMAPIGSFIAVTNTINLPIIILGVGVCLWIGGFDAMYGSQDEEFDRAHGLHSLATQFTARMVFPIIDVAHAVSILCFFYVGYAYQLPHIYYVGIGLAAGTLVYQHSIISATDYSRVTPVYFLRNGIVSICIFAFTVISLLQ